jgi:hypothetical protein
LITDENTDLEDEEFEEDEFSQSKLMGEFTVRKAASEVSFFFMIIACF